MSCFFSPQITGELLIMSMYHVQYVAHQHSLDLCWTLFQTDSGGPLVSLKDGVWWLIGDSIWGEHCAEQNKPGVYGNVSHFLDWIHDQMKVNTQKLTHKVFNRSVKAVKIWLQSIQRISMDCMCSIWLNLLGGFWNRSTVLIQDKILML